MRTLPFAALIAVASALPGAGARAQVSVSASIAVGQPVEVATFHERLGPYGRWVFVAGYGDVWVPAGVGPGFRPYSNGRWVLTEYGWTFVSDDPWGWATWHYGNWVFADGNGWVWVPGRVWAPAWVSWRMGGGYAAWAPLPPPWARVQVVAVSSPGWVVVEQRSFTQPVATVAVVGGTASAVYVQRAQPLAMPVQAGAIGVNPGPHPAVIATATGHAVQPVAANAVVGHGTAAIAHAPNAPAPPPQVARAVAQRWGTRPEQVSSLHAPVPADHAQRLEAAQAGRAQRQNARLDARDERQRAQRAAGPARGPGPARAQRGRRRGW